MWIKFVSNATYEQGLSPFDLLSLNVVPFYGSYFVYRIKQKNKNVKQYLITPKALTENNNFAHLSLIKRKRFQGIAIVVKFSEDKFVITSQKGTGGVSIVLREVG